ncbi:Cytochrome b5 [Ophiocordyceps sinensis CO18]|uniref:Cytochrome b5 n=1 Tax=Ophiocordyceps sinensis (strain Co18 / CGMCC 3.14243) TaxID=911162 RepID=T5ABF5_OPHSC|nr:Cytochrome b5 [Ophiocordyceps sinensis CO18]
MYLLAAPVQPAIIGPDVPRLLDPCFPSTLPSLSRFRAASAASALHPLGSAPRRSTMGVVGVSLVLASIIYFIVRPPAWLTPMLSRLLDLWGPVAPAPVKPRDHDADTALRISGRGELPEAFPSTSTSTSSSGRPEPLSDPPRDDRAAMPPPPPPPVIHPPTIDEPDIPATTPEASARNGGLAPPPTHSSKPQKPRRKVTLDPGHSPLDWARVSGGGADLRGVDPETPYLRVPPSMLMKQTGRKGKDAWMAINGKVYNVTPYAKFHPGGVPELMRGAGGDGAKLFGEIHPWVNYETMLAACLVGLLVEEPVGDSAAESEMDKLD